LHVEDLKSETPPLIIRKMRAQWYAMLSHIAANLHSIEIAAKSVAAQVWDEEGLSLLQLHTSKHLRPSNYGEAIGLGKDEPMTWPDNLDYPAFNIPFPIRIFVWSFAGFLPETGTSQLGNCTVDFTTKSIDMHIPTSDYDVSDADVLLFGLPNMIWEFPKNYILPKEKSAKQMWITTCEEPVKRTGLSKADCRLLQDNATMEMMDFTSSYDMLSDVPALFDSVYFEDLKTMPPDFSVNPSDELATLAVSDCESTWRNTWLEEVMAEVEKTGHKVLSYGECLHNTKEPREAGKPKHKIQGWIDREAARPFKLVAENVLQPWYVTEKIWNALAEGSVPVYLGPPEVKEMMPEGSFIYADDFPSTQALVQRMLDFTPEDFAKAHAWREKPTSEWGMWETTWMQGRHTMMNRICEFAAKQMTEGKQFKSGVTPAAHDLPCCPEDPSCCKNWGRNL